MRSYSSFNATFLIAFLSIASSHAAAQDDTSLAGPETAAALDAPRDQDRLELAQRIGYSFGGTSALSTETSLGIVLSDHLVFVNGVGFTASRDESGFSSSGGRTWTVASGLKIYTRAPGARVFTPTFRVVAMYFGSHGEYEYRYNEDERQRSGYLSHSLGGTVTAGATYFIDDTVGILFEAGIAAGGLVAGDVSENSPYGVRQHNVTSTFGATLVIRR